MPSQCDLEAGPVFRVLASAAAPTLRSLSLNVIAGASVGAYSEYLSILQAQPHLKSFTVRGLVPTCDGDDPLAFALESLHLWEVDEDQGDHVFSPFFKLVSGSSHASLQSLSLPYLDHGFEMPILTPFSRLTYLSLLDLPLDPTSFICQVPFLPIRELYIKAQDGPPLSFLAALPPTLEVVDLPGTHLPTAVLPFLESGRCPLLRAFDSSHLQPLSPFDQMALAAACQRRGLVLQQHEPRILHRGELEAEE